MINRDVTPQYRIIYNWDGAPHFYSEYPQSVAEFVDKTFAPLTGTQVDALFWSMGEHEATWPSTSLSVIGDSTDRQYTSVREMRHVEGIRAAFERGDNPYAEMIDYGHQNNKKCVDCTAHCGYEPTAVDEATSTFRGMVDSAKMVFQ